MASPSDAGTQSPRGGETPENIAVEPVSRATKKARNASEEHIKDIVTRMIALANRAAWDDPELVAHLAPNFVWDTFNIHKETSRAEHLEFMQTVTDRNPDFHAEIKDITVDVQEKLGRAKVWVVMTIRGWPSGVEREALHVFYYRRGEDGKWLCSRHHGFNGVAPLPLPFEAADAGDGS